MIKLLTPPDVTFFSRKMPPVRNAKLDYVARE